MANVLGFPPVPLSGTPPKQVSNAAESRWVRIIAETVNRILGGKMNVTLSVTLTANSATTTVTDARIGPFSALLFMPATAHASAEIAAGSFYVSAQQNGQATITNANNAQTDRTFTMAILG